MKVKLYDIDTIFQKKLLFLIPFYIFTFEEQLPEIEKSKEKIAELKRIYGDILSRLNEMCEADDLDEYTKKAICDMAEKM